MPQFKIDQVALYPKDPERAKELLTAMGAGDWAEDVVIAVGDVRGKEGMNKASLSFDYSLLENARELEVLQYKDGPNWMDNRAPRVSHLGMHCSYDELEEWRAFFHERNIKVAQEVETYSHTNPVIAGKRWYKYVIFDTYEILGVDVKFIVRNYF